MRVVALMLTILAGVASPASANPFLGPWQHVSVKNSFEFLPKGRLLVTIGNLPMPLGDYQVLSANRVVVNYRIVAFGTDTPVASTLTLKKGLLCFDDPAYRTSCYRKRK